MGIRPNLFFEKTKATAKKAVAWVVAFIKPLERLIYRKIDLKFLMKFYILFAVLPVFITSSVITYYVFDRQKKSDFEKASELINSVVITTETNMDSITNLASSICYDYNFNSFFTQEYNEDSYFTYTNTVFPKVNTVISAAGSNITNMFIFMKNTTIPEGYDIFKYFNEDISKIEKTASLVNGDWIVYEYNGQKSLCYVQGIYHFIDDELSAIIMFRISEEFFIPKNTSSSSEIWIKGSGITYSSSYESVPEIKGGFAREKDYVIAKTDIDSIGTECIVRMPYETSSKYLSLYIIPFVIFLFLSIILCLWILFIVVSDANKMISQIEAVMANDLKGVVSTESRFGLAIIAEKFNKIIEQIHYLVDDSVEKMLAQRSSQIAAMQYQINPHMFCNSLQVVQYRLELEGQYETSNLIALLGKIMRYSIDDKSILTNIKLEIEHLKSYIEFQEYRMKEGELEFEYFIEDGLEDVSMIKLTLQPIVENAIKHGKPKGKPIKITVNIYSSGNNVRFEVTNTGIRIDDDKIKKMTDLINEKSHEGQGNSIGLKNINHRLTLFYSAECALQIGRNEYGDTVIAFEIPNNRKTGADK